MVPGWSHRCSARGQIPELGRHPVAEHVDPADADAESVRAGQVVTVRRLGSDRREVQPLCGRHERYDGVILSPRLLGAPCQSACTETPWPAIGKVIRQRGFSLGTTRKPRFPSGFEGFRI
jgi:hypothetical protein